MVPFVLPAKAPSQRKERLHGLAPQGRLVAAKPLEDTAIKVDEPLECVAQTPQ